MLTWPQPSKNLDEIASRANYDTIEKCCYLTVMM